MAYAATISRESGPDGVIEIVIRETEAGTATESQSFALPQRFRMLSVKADLLSGAGSTVSPEIYWVAASGAADTKIFDAGTPGANLDTTYGAGLMIRAPHRVGYHRAVCDAGSDNVVVTRYRIQPNW